jgi:hypothetical protein
MSIDPTSVYFVQSVLDSNLVADIRGAKDQSGAEVQVYTIKFAPGAGTDPSSITQQQLQNAANQLWTFPDGPGANSFYIQSVLDSSLVVDIAGGKAASGTALVVNRKSANAKGQLWTLAPAPDLDQPGPLRNTFWFIQSVLDSNLVVDIRGAQDKSGTPLQLYTKKQVTTKAQYDAAKNQLWSRTPAYCFFGDPK